MYLIFKKWVNNRVVLISFALSIFIHFFIFIYFFQLRNENIINFKSSIVYVYLEKHIDVATLEQFNKEVLIDKLVKRKLVEDIDEPVLKSALIPVLDSNQKNINYFDNIYYEKNQLTVVPFLTNNIILNYPEDFFSKITSYVTIVTIYINKNGLVDSVEFTDHDFPESLKNVILSEFIKASFNAGEIDNVSVNSKINIEVRFDK